MMSLAYLRGNEEFCLTNIQQEIVYTVIYNLRIIESIIAR